MSRLRNMTPDNYQDRVVQSVSDTLKEQIADRQLAPLFENTNIELPPGKHVYDVIESLVDGNNTIELLSQIYASLDTFGMYSEFYLRAVEIVNSGLF